MPSLGPIDPRSYGAILDGSVDDSAALQAALDAASVQHIDSSGPRGAVEMPVGSVARIDSPLVIRSSRVAFSCAEFAGAQLRASGQFPMVTVEPPVPDTPLVPSLVQGPGNAWQLGRGWINLSDASGAGSIDGLQAFTLRWFMRLDAPAGSTTTWASAGRYAGGMLLSQALLVGFLNGSNAPRVTLRTTGSGTQTLIPQTQLVVGKVHHLVVQYDGSVLAIFVDGQPVASMPMSGAVDQAPWEELCLGALLQTFPNQIPATYATPATIDGAELWAKSLYPIAPFVPPSAKQPTQRPDVMFNNGQLFQCNFEATHGSLVRCQVGQKAGTLSAWLRVYGPVAPGTLTEVSVRNLLFIGGSTGVEATQCQAVLLDGLSFDHGWRSVVVRDNCYFSDLSRIKCDYPGRGGVWLYHASGLTSLRNIRVNGSRFPVAAVNNQMSVEAQNVFVGATGTTIGMLMSADDGGGLGGSVTNYNFSDEVLDPTPGRLQAPLVLSGLGDVALSQLNLYTGSGFRGTNSAPSIIVDGCRVADARALRLELSQASQAAIRFVRPPDSPMRVPSVTVGPTGAPLTTPDQAKYVATS